MSDETVDQVMTRLGDKAPRVTVLRIPEVGVEIPPHVIFTRVHGRWEDFAHLGDPVVIDGGTVDHAWTDADLFAHGYMGIKVRGVTVTESTASAHDAPPAPMTEHEALSLAILALNTVTHPEGTDDAMLRLLDQRAEEAMDLLVRLREKSGS